MTDKKSLSERDICTKYINPALEKAGWNIQTQVREEVSFTDGRIYVKGNLSTRGKREHANFRCFKDKTGVENRKKDSQKLEKSKCVVMEIYL